MFYFIPKFAETQFMRSESEKKQFRTAGFVMEWIVRTVSGLGGQFLDCLDSFRIVWTVSGLSGPEVSE